MAMQPASGYMATVSQISSLQWRTPFFADSSLMPGSAVETPKAAGLGPRSDQLTDSVIPCSHPASILRASLKEKISQRCCKCHAVIVRCAGPPCMWMTLTLSVCHAWGNPTLTPPSAGPFSSSQGSVHQTGRVVSPRAPSGSLPTLVPLLCTTSSQNCGAPLLVSHPPSASVALTSIDGAEDKGYERLPPQDESVAAHLCPPTAIGWKAKASHPSKLCRATSALTGRAYSVVGQTASALHSMAVLQVF